MLTFTRQCHTAVQATLISTICCAGASNEGGQEASDGLVESLRFLSRHDNMRSCYWACPTCNTSFNSGAEFARHVQDMHEEIACIDEAGPIYVMCEKCEKPVRTAARLTCQPMFTKYHAQISCVLHSGF